MAEKRKFNVKLTADEIRSIRYALKNGAAFAKGAAHERASQMPPGFRDSVLDANAFSLNQAYEIFAEATKKGGK